jgi:hypothetical protein
MNVLLLISLLRHQVLGEADGGHHAMTEIARPFRECRSLLATCRTRQQKKLRRVGALVLANQMPIRFGRSYGKDYGNTATSKGKTYSSKARVRLSASRSALECPLFGVPIEPEDAVSTF